MVLRLRIKVCHEGKCIECLGIANTGFAGREPEITLPQDVARRLLGPGLNTTLVERVLADGTKVLLTRVEKLLDLYLIAEDRVEGPVKVYAYIVRGGFVLLNDCVLSTLRVVIIDPREGIWCFRDELGKRERTSA